jgi:hypothetical protein
LPRKPQRGSYGILCWSVTGDVEAGILGVSDEVNVSRSDALASVHDEDMKKINLDIFAPLLGLEEVEECTKNPVSADGEKNKLI